MLSPFKATFTDLRDKNMDLLCRLISWPIIISQVPSSRSRDRSHKT